MDMGAKHVSFKERFHFVTEEVSEDLGDGEAPNPDLEVCACTVVHKDNNKYLKSSEQERFRVWDVTLKNMRAKLQIPPPGPFDKIDIFWEEEINQGRGMSRNTCKAINPHLLFHL